MKHLYEVLVVPVENIYLTFITEAAARTIWVGPEWNGLPRGDRGVYHVRDRIHADIRITRNGTKVD